MPLKHPDPHWHYLHRALTATAPSLARRGTSRCSTSSFPRALEELDHLYWTCWEDTGAWSALVWCLCLSCTALCQQLQRLITSKLLITSWWGQQWQTSTVLLQAGVLVCTQVVLDLEIRASCTTGTKEILRMLFPLLVLLFYSYWSLPATQWPQFNSALTSLLFAKPTFAKPIWIQFKQFCNNPLERKALL